MHYMDTPSKCSSSVCNRGSDKFDPLLLSISNVARVKWKTQIVENVYRLRLHALISLINVCSIVLNAENCYNINLSVLMNLDD